MKTLMAISMLILMAASSAKPDDIIGMWLDESRKIIVETYKENGAYSAKLVWFENERKDIQRFCPEGLPKSQWIGAKVMRGFRFEDGRWRHGKIYLVKTGKIRDAEIRLVSKGLMEVRGYVFAPAIGESVLFSRYAAGLPAQE